MANVEKANKAAEKLARATGDSFEAVIDHTVAMQERNAKFAQSVLDGTAREIRQQAESNRQVVAEFVDRAEKQRGAFQTLVEESVDAYTDFLFAPLSYYKQGLRVVENEISGNGGFPGAFPIQNYDELNVEEIGKRVDKLSAEEIRTIHDYERRHKNRETVITQIDRKLKPSTS